MRIIKPIHTLGNESHFNEQVTYNSNGSITSLLRKGRKNDGTFGAIDELTVDYDGNRLLKVTDDAEALNYNSALDFNDGDDSDREYQYDSNGALTKDSNRGITSITYDYGNPRRIQFDNGNVTKYVYSATGQKLRVVYQTAVPNITVAMGSTRELMPSEILYTDSTDYLLGGSLTLRNGRIDKYQFEEGYCQATQYNATQDNFMFYYYDRDHLGNVRQVTKAMGSTGTVMQTMNYYPFGSQFCDGSAASGDVQPYRYNGKELDKMHGLNTYDYGARQYNPITARWDRPDPLAEKYYPYSPYMYCLGNPIGSIDINGLYPRKILTKHAHNYLWNVDYYKLSAPAAHALSLLSGVSESTIANVEIWERGIGHYMPTYKAGNGGGAITLGNENIMIITLTENFFEDNAKEYNNHGYGQDIDEWISILSHEVGHLPQIGKDKSLMKYLGNTIFEYIKGGSHDESVREIEAERGSKRYQDLKDFSKEKRKRGFAEILSTDSTDEEKINSIDDIWNEYMKYINEM